MKTALSLMMMLAAATALAMPVSALGASASASANCFSSPNPYTGLTDWFPSGSYSGSASASLLDIGAQLLAWGSGTQAVSKADAGAWPAKLTASASGYAGEALGYVTAIPYGSTVTMEGHASASSTLQTPLVANQVDYDTCL